MKNIVIGYGNVGRLIAAELKKAGEQVTIGRHEAADGSDSFDSIGVDLLDAVSVQQAIEGHDRVFVTTGLPYKLSVWRAEWPIIIDNVIAAAKSADAKLIFIDNIYLYGPSPLQNPIMEQHPRSPVSKKGAVRLKLVEKLEAAMQDVLEVLIVRCADFYGPRVNSSGLTMAVDAATKGKKPYFMGNEATRHSYSYVPDIAKATVLLALATDTYNQTWHAPTAPALTGIELKKLVEKSMSKKVAWSTLRPGTMRLLELFVPILRELHEMMYQFENDYVFDSSKFQQRFPDFAVMPYDAGIANTIAASLT